MKAILFSLACVFSLTTIDAQVNFGLRTNISMSTSSQGTVQLKNASPVEVIDFSYISSNTGYGAGAFVYGSNDLLFFMTEALYQSNSSNFLIASDINNLQRQRTSREFQISKSSISIPVAAGLKFKNFKIGTGPIFNFTVSQSDNLGELESINVKQDPFNSGFQFLIGYEILNRIHIDLKREINFSRASEGISYHDERVKLDSSVSRVSLSLGVLF